MRHLIISFVILSILCLDGEGQEIKVHSISKSENDISAREHLIKDANGDGCAIVKVRTGLKNLKISSDMGINHIEEREGEVWIWVTRGTKTLQLELDQFRKLNIELPSYAEEYMVYLIAITAVLPPEVVFEDAPTHQFHTEPNDASLFIDGIYQGQTPLNLSVPADTFNYRLSKKRYLQVNDVGNGSESGSYHITLKKDKYAKRFFINLVYFPYKYVSYCGFQMGSIGDFGWYGSFLITLGEPDQETIPEAYSYTSRNGLSFGGFQRIGKNSYTQFGILWGYKDIYNYNAEPSRYADNESFGAFGVELGLLFRSKDHLLVGFNNTIYLAGDEPFYGNFTNYFINPAITFGYVF